MDFIRSQSRYTYPLPPTQPAPLCPPQKCDCISLNINTHMDTYVHTYTCNTHNIMANAQLYPRIYWLKECARDPD